MAPLTLRLWSSVCAALREDPCFFWSQISKDSWFHLVTDRDGLVVTSTLHLLGFCGGVTDWLITSAASQSSAEVFRLPLLPYHVGFFGVLLLSPVFSGDFDVAAV
ncbi:Hypothetical predicted protein [Olea europaea subsp. europaea]|uniref:Uncharacterized protein n=1 Tax=Olea europaea subsp. europaea TaxID=158383 RepID=A0A8S0PKF6_OLEEU|nr:Hypothetical predicted protein [Olea europaea subsp. europaea]